MGSKEGAIGVSHTLLPVAGASATPKSPFTNPESKQRIPSTVQAWVILFIHGACCVAIALAIAFGLDGYKAGEKSSPHRVEGKLLLRVSDVTTLVSVALVVVKVIVSVWSTLILWGFGQHMLTHESVPSQQVWKMVRWRIPPEFQTLRSLPKGYRGWIISVTVISIFIQAFTGPLLTGSVSWNAAFHLSKQAVPVSSVDPRAAFSSWYWYNAQGPFDKKAYLRAATRYASLAWMDTSTIDAKGGSKTGNGCRSVMNDGRLPRNSSLVDATLPCIKINSIRWYRNEDEVTKEEWSDLSGDDLTLVDDNPFYYYYGGVTIVYDAKKLRSPPSSTDEPPPANKFSGTMTVALMLARRNETDPPCSKLPNTVFGNISPLPYLVKEVQPTSKGENCFLLGKIDLTAGVTKSSRATYIGDRIVESQTPIQDVEFEANPWVQEALWLLPDLLTMLAISNVTIPPAFENIDSYVSGIVRQGYLAAWDLLHHSFDDKGPLYQSFPAQERLVADVSFARVFAWLGISLSMTLFGIFALVLVLNPADLMPPGGNEGVMNAGALDMTDKLAGGFAS